MLGRQTAFLHSDAGIGCIAQSSGTSILRVKKNRLINIKHTQIIIKKPISLRDNDENHKCYYYLTLNNNPLDLNWIYEGNSVMHQWTKVNSKTQFLPTRMFRINSIPLVTFQKFTSHCYLGNILLRLLKKLGHV